MGIKIRGIVNLWGWGWGLTGKRHEGIFWGNGNVLCLDWDGDYIGEYICQKLTKKYT